MPDRQIDYGEDATDATYRSGDAGGTTGGGNFVVAELLGDRVLFEWDQTANEWVSRGPVNLSGNDLANVGTLSATTVDAGSVSTENLQIGGHPSRLWTEIDRAETSGDFVSFTGLQPGEEYAIRFRTIIDGTADFEVWFNGDDASGSYDYWRNDGTIIEDANTIQLADFSSSFAGMAGTIFFEAGTNETDRIGLSHSIKPSSLANFNSFSVAGGGLVGDALSSVTIGSASGSASGGSDSPRILYKAVDAE